MTPDLPTAPDLSMTPDSSDGPGQISAGPEAGPASPALDYLLAAWLTLLAMIIGVFSVFFLPSHIGAVPFPLSAVIGAGVVFWTVRTSYRLTGSMVAAFAPAVAWLGISGWLSTSVVLGFGLVIGDWRAQLLLGLGALAAAVALGSAWGGHVSKKVRAVGDR